MLADGVERGVPTLGICLGLQLFAAASDESVGVDGLALFDRAVERLPDDVRLPHMGFNDVIPEPGARLVERGAAYFAHSYALRDPPAGFIGARATHGVSFMAALERGALLFCQFHPELSGAYGRALLGRWLDATRAGGL